MECEGYEEKSGAAALGCQDRDQAKENGVHAHSTLEPPALEHQDHPDAQTGLVVQDPEVVHRLMARLDIT